MALEVLNQTGNHTVKSDVVSIQIRIITSIYTLIIVSINHCVGIIFYIFLLINLDWFRSFA